MENQSFLIVYLTLSSLYLLLYVLVRYLFKKYSKNFPPISETHLKGIIIALLGSFTFIIGFSLTVFMGNYSRASNAVFTEGAEIALILFKVEQAPEDVKQQTKNFLRSYVSCQIDEEWPANAKGKSAKCSINIFREFYQYINKLTFGDRGEVYRNIRDSLERLIYAHDTKVSSIGFVTYDFIILLPIVYLILLVVFSAFHSVEYLKTKKDKSLTFIIHVPTILMSCVALSLCLIAINPFSESLQVSWLPLVSGINADLGFMK